MLRMLLVTAVAAATLPALPAAAQYGGGGYPPSRAVRCESFNYRPARCAVDLGRVADVQVQQVLGGRCVQGDTWSWDRGGIQVSGGCRANFQVNFPAYPGPGGGGYPGGPGPVGGIECNSWKYQYQTCALPGNGRPQLVRVIAGNCIEGQTWGGRRGEVWVDKGCRGVFASGGGGGGGYPGGPGGGYPGGPGGGYPGNGGPGGAQFINCESWNYAYAECPAPGRRVEFDRVIAGQCDQGASYGFTRRGIWVDKGCRARFAVY